MWRSSQRQSGLTLLEVLVALSIFALIGVASFRVLSTVIQNQQRGDQHSQQLGQWQKAMNIIGADLQQPAGRAVINPEGVQEPALWVNSAEAQYPLAMTRSGWRNPLQLSRSNLQRVAYDLGPHPDSDKVDSPHYQDEATYLRRHYWRHLDRSEDSAPVTQALLADIDQLEVTVYSEKGPHTSWPLATNQIKEGDIPQLVAIELALHHPVFGEIRRIFAVY